MLLNCGASTHVRGLAPASCAGVRFVVVDSHRPIHPRYNDPEDIDTLLVLEEDDPLPRQDIPLANEDLDNITPEGGCCSDAAAAARAAGGARSLHGRGWVCWW